MDQPRAGHKVQGRVSPTRASTSRLPDSRRSRRRRQRVVRESATLPLRTRSPRADDPDFNGTHVDCERRCPHRFNGFGHLPRGRERVAGRAEDAGRERQRPALWFTRDALRAVEALRKSSRRHRRVQQSARAATIHATGCDGADYVMRRAVQRTPSTTAADIAALAPDNTRSRPTRGRSRRPGLRRAWRRRCPVSSGVVVVSRRRTTTARLHSNYGQGAVDVAAPAAAAPATPPDSYFSPAELAARCLATATEAPSLGPFDDECPTVRASTGLHGTSMADPERGSVAALIQPLRRLLRLSRASVCNWTRSLQQRLESSSNAQPGPSPQPVHSAVPPRSLVFRYRRARASRAITTASICTQSSPPSLRS